MTHLVASKLSEASMHSTPTTFKFTSPYDAIAVLTAMSSMAMISRLVGLSSPATNKASIVAIGVNACSVVSTLSYNTTACVTMLGVSTCRIRTAVMLCVDSVA